MGMQRLIPLPDVCVRLKLPHSVVYRLVLAGKLRGERAGTRWVVMSQDVERLAGLLREERAAAGARPE